jgi:uncharacterized protein YdeI (YjbR/CyaY-like superfamily)
VLAELGQGKRPKFSATFPNGYVHRTTVGPHAGAAFLSVSAAVREGAEVAAGDVIELDLVPDTAPREVEVPDDLAAAFAATPAAQTSFESLTDSQRRTFVSSVTSAKKPETRERRVDRAVEALVAGEKRP